MGGSPTVGLTMVPTTVGATAKAYDERVAYFEAEGRAGTGGYTCPQCGTRASDLPAECATCRLTLISAPHLARSYHHLFPVPVFQDRTPAGEGAEGGDRCFGCSSTIVGVRLRCPRCAHTFCFDCDSYIHDKVFVCPGCCDR